MHDDLKRRLRDEVADELGTRPPTDLSDVLRRGHRKRRGIRLMATVSMVLLGSAVVAGGLWIANTASPTDDGRRSIPPADDEAGPSEPTPPEGDQAGYGFLDGAVTFAAAEPWGHSVAGWDHSRTITTLTFDHPDQATAFDQRFMLVADPSSTETGCEAGPASTDADGLAQTIRSDPDLEATQPVSDMVGGVNALRMDVRAAPGASVCEDEGWPQAITGGSGDGGTAVGIPVGHRMRLYLLDFPGEEARILAIAITAPEDLFNTVLEAAAPIVNSIQFNTTAWSPVRERDASDVHHGNTWQDPLDAQMGWVDVKRVRFSRTYLARADGKEGYVQPTWTIKLAAPPPGAADLEPGRLIAYGLVLDTNRDGAADYVVGIDNDAPERGDLHVWVTDLSTGETDEQIGPPYGYPIEFSHPDEERPIGSSGEDMVFTFVPGSGPADLNARTVRFYAWASETRGDEVVASDYAPNTGWMQD